MDKNLYELFNEIEVEIDENERIDLDDISRKKYKKNMRKLIRKKKKINIKAIAIAMSLILLFSKTQFGQKVYADISTKLKEMSYTAMKIIFNEYSNEDYKNYIEIIDKIVESKNIGIKLTEVAADKNSLLLAMVIDMEDEIQDLKDYNNMNINRYGIDIDYDLKINGKKMDVINAVSLAERIDYNGIYGYKIFLDIENIDEAPFDIDVDINKITFRDNIKADRDIVKEIKGDWKFDFTLSKEEIFTQYNNFKLDKSLSHRDIDYSLEELTISPINARIVGKINLDNISKNEKDYIKDNFILKYLLVFEGETDTGEKFLFGNGDVDFKTGDIIFKYLGKDYYPLRIYTTSDLINKFKNVKYIKLTPYYLNKIPKAGFVMPQIEDLNNRLDYDKGEEFIINLEN